MKFIYSPSDPYEGCYSLATVLKSGESFGELALISSNPRAATIKCSSDTQLASISKSEYQEIIGKLDKKMLEKKILMMKNIPWLK